MLQSNKGGMYLNYKDNLELEPYFKILHLNDCITLFKFRTSNHNLPIEVGRWDGPLVENRKCTLCTHDALGSEQHYLLLYNQFTSARNKWLPSISYNVNNLHYFTELLKNKNEKTLQKLCTFIYVIMSSFK